MRGPAAPDTGGLDQSSWPTDSLAPASVPAAPDDGGATLKLLLSQQAPEILRVLGRGAQAVVYARHDAALRRELASKELHLPSSSAIAVARLVREARALARLDHPGVPPIYAFGRTGDTLYLHMRSVAGRPLSVLAAEQPEMNRRLAVLVPALASVCRVVAAAHDRGVIHRDLKPEHIIVGERGEVSVVDWGLARLLGEPALDEEVLDEEVAESGQNDALTQLGTRLGTPGYWSPEQAEGRSSEAGPASDIWALGRNLQFLVEGGPPIASAVTRGPPALRSVIRRALRQDEPYADAAQMAADLDAWRAGEPVPSHKYRLWERVALAAVRHAVASLASALVLGLVGLLIGVVWAQRSADARATAAWVQDITDRWLQRAPVGDGAWAALAAARAPGPPDRGMWLAIEDSDRPLLLDKDQRFSVGGRCGARTLELVRGGAICFSGPPITYWSSPARPAATVGVMGDGYQQMEVNRLWTRFLLANRAGDIEVYDLSGAQSRQVAAIAAEATGGLFLLQPDVVLLVSDDAAWAQRLDGQILWRRDARYTLVPMEWADAALLIGQDGAVSLADVEGTRPTGCSVNVPDAAPRNATEDWLVWRSSPTALGLLDLKSCQITSWGLDFQVSRLGIDPAGEHVAVSAVDGRLGLLRRRDGLVRRLVVPGGVASVGFEAGGVLRAVQADGRLWRFDTGSARGVRLDGPVEAITWAGDAMWVSTAGGTWRLSGAPFLDAPERLADRAWPWADGVVTLNEGLLAVHADGVDSAIPWPSAVLPRGGVQGDALYLLGEDLSAWHLPELSLMWRATVDGEVKAMEPAQDAVLLLRPEGVERVDAKGRQWIWRGSGSGVWFDAEARIHIGSSTTGRQLIEEGANWTETYGLSENVLIKVRYGGDLAASLGDRGDISLWRGDAQAVSVLTGRRIRVVAPSPNGRWLAVGDADGLVQLWDLSWLDLTPEQALSRIWETTGIDVDAGQIVAGDAR